MNGQSTGKEMFTRYTEYRCNICKRWISEKDLKEHENMHKNPEPREIYEKTLKGHIVRWEYHYSDSEKDGGGFGIHFGEPVFSEVSNAVIIQRILVVDIGSTEKQTATIDLYGDNSGDSVPYDPVTMSIIDYATMVRELDVLYYKIRGMVGGLEGLMEAD